MAKPEMTFDQWWVGSHYRNFVEQEGAPLYEGSFLEDLCTLELADWERRGGKVGYTRLADQEKIGFQVVEIPPKGQLKPEHHMYEAVMYVLKGSGATQIWQEGEPRRTIEWSEGALLAIPLNAWHQEFNNSGSEPCRLLFGNNMPQIINLYHDVKYVFNNPYSFKNRYSYSMEDYYTDSGTHRNLRLFETNFIPDIRSFKLDEWKERGTRTSIMRLYMGNASSQIHILEVGEGTYVTAHRHGSGPHVMIIGGEGYELLFFPGAERDPSKRLKVPAKPYGVVAPKLNEYHQHFNTGRGPFRQLAFKGWDPSGAAITGKGQYDPVGAAKSDDPFAYSFKLRYDKEDPNIREDYYKALEQNGIDLRLPPLDQGGG